MTPIKSTIKFLTAVLQRIWKLVQRATGWDGFWWIAGIAAVLVVGIFLSWRFWEELHGTQGSHSTTIRNVGLVVGGVIAILLAVWRSTVAERQTATAQQSLLNERYQKGAEMLGSGVLSVRLGGIYALQRLAEEHPEQYHVQIMQLFCAFVRHPTKDDGGAAKPDEKDRLREDVQAVMRAIGTRGEAGIALEKKANLPLDLHGADLSGVFLPRGTNLSGANLTEANLSSVRFSRVNLSGAALHQTNLSSASLSFAIGLTQEQLDEACADAGHLPRYLQPPKPGSKFLRLKDAETGEPLVWHGQLCRDVEG
ncbi:MAG: pentapeptide repeat-containing protein [Chloroflexi bacterium]|nr:pentapeptide repeat-containing protein [Chloroflexota bacterium]